MRAVAIKIYRIYRVDIKQIICGHVKYFCQRNQYTCINLQIRHTIEQTTTSETILLQQDYHNLKILSMKRSVST